MDEIIEYFNLKAIQYDDTDKQAYWRFSDRLLLGLLERLFLPTDKEASFTFLDAGGGTGRWTHNLLALYPQASSVVVDISPEMLAIAQQKFQRFNYQKRTRIIQADLANLPEVVSDTFDFALCFHNVIGFVDNPNKVLLNICSRLKKGGSLLLMAPSYYHALYFSNAHQRSGELRRITEQRFVCYNDAMPPLRVFEIPEMNDLLSTAGFSHISSYGFPITLYPGMNETFIEGETQHLANVLNETSQNLFDVEMQLCQNSLVAPRGNNLLFIAQKNY